MGLNIRTDYEYRPKILNVLGFVSARFLFASYLRDYFVECLQNTEIVEF